MQALVDIIRDVTPLLRRSNRWVTLSPWPLSTVWQPLALASIGVLPDELPTSYGHPRPIKPLVEGAPDSLITEFSRLPHHCFASLESRTPFHHYRRTKYGLRSTSSRWTGKNSCERGETPRPKLQKSDAGRPKDRLTFLELKPRRKLSKLGLEQWNEPH